MARTLRATLPARFAGLPSLAGLGGAVRQAQHVRAARVFGALTAYGRGEAALGVDLVLEAGQEAVPGGLGASGPVAGPAPRHFGGYSLVEVTGQ